MITTKQPLADVFEVGPEADLVCKILHRAFSEPHRTPDTKTLTVHGFLGRVNGF
jgi:hypothetical protein